MMDDDAIKECGMHTAHEVVRNMGVQIGEVACAYASPIYGQSFTSKSLPQFVTWPPPNPYPVPRAEPSTTDQELGALKHRVGLLEAQMRELVEKFKRRGKR